MQPSPNHAARAGRSQARELVRLAAPIAASQAGFATMGLVDTAVVGRLGAAALGAVGLANGLFLAGSIIGMGVMMGLDPLLSQAFGAGDERRARQITWQGVWLAALTTCALALPIALTPLLLGPAGIHGPVARQTTFFLWCRLPGLLPMFLFVGLRAYVQAEGRAQVLLVAMVAANIANFFFDVLLVFGGGGLPGWTGPLRLVPALGAPGAAISTSLCSALMVAILVVPVRRSFAKGSLAPVSRRPAFADLRGAARLGIPVGLQLGAEVGVFALVGVLVGRFGEVALAAHQIALSLASLTFCFAAGVGNAGSVLVGWAVGARDTAGARRAGLLAFAAGGGFMACCALSFWLWPRPLAGLLTDAPDVIAATVPLLAVAAVFQISDGVQGVGAGVLRGAGETHFAFVANVVGHYLVGLPLALLLGFKLGLGFVGLWWGLCGGLTAVALGLFARFVRVSSRPIVPLEPHLAAGAHAPLPTNELLATTADPGVAARTAEPDARARQP